MDDRRIKAGQAVYFTAERPADNERPNIRRQMTDTAQESLGRNRPIEKIEILSVDLLAQNRPQVVAFKRLARSLGLELGWHYLLDLTWIVQHLGTEGRLADKVHPTDEGGQRTSGAQTMETLQGMRIMDAGAGTGILQWYLAQEGAEVISVDRLSRAALPLRFRRHFRVRGLRTEDLLPAFQALWSTTKANFEKQRCGTVRGWFSVAAALGKDIIASLKRPTGSGRVIIYNQDLMNLKDLPDNSLDAAVAVSSLEHNSPEGLERVVGEILRVLKPGGMLLATLMAGRDQDWWHEPSSGWCYTASSLRRLFDLPPSTPSNYDRFDALFAALQDCAELRDNLASFYFKSEKNGMPWGVWDPRYPPVGVVKIKQRQ
jgi:SAM-dependent methyltransferase